MTDEVQAFYDDLAPDSHLVFADWENALVWQGRVLDDLIRRFLPAGTVSVLDCSCGIGTQSIALALRGYRIFASDLSSASVERARAEALRRGVSIDFAVADMRTLASAVPGEFDVVLSFDNALPHLVADADLELAARNMAAKLRPGGVLLASIRDYDAVAAEKPRSDPPRILPGRVLLQTWEWQPDGRTYRMHHFILTEQSGNWSVRHRSAIYRALLRGELTAVLETAGLRELCWHTPEESGFYQPVVSARKPVI